MYGTKSTIMDLIEILNNATKLGYSLVKMDEDTLKLGNCLTTLFVRNGEVHGWFKAIPGEGFRWNYPQDLVEYTKEQAA